jgi:arabinofuranosyltransferase
MIPMSLQRPGQYPAAHLLANNMYKQTPCSPIVISFNYVYDTLGNETSLFLFLTALALMRCCKRQFFGLAAA